MSTVAPRKYTVTLDDTNHCYVIKPLKINNTMDVATFFRVIKAKTKISWKDLAAFSGLSSASRAFRVAYLTKLREDMTALNEYLVVDATSQTAYFYDKNHKPEGTIAVHVGPTLVNNEPTSQTVTTNIPVRVGSRVNIGDTLNRNLTMTITPTNGYILGVNDVNLCSPNIPYVVSGSKNSLNRILKNMNFVAVAAGSASIVIAVTDHSTALNGTVSTTINMTAVAGTVVSIPTITLPENPVAVLNTDCDVGTITVADDDGKLMEVTVQPFGCEVFGFKSFLGVLVPGTAHSVYGRPETLNEELANLKIRATQTNAQIGVQLVCGKTIIRKYVAFSVADGSDGNYLQPGEDTDDSNGVTDTPAVASDAGTDPVEEPQVEKPQTDTVEEPQIVINSSELIGAAGEELDLGLSFTGSDDTKLSTKISVTGCSITGLSSGSDIADGDSRTFSGTVTQLNTKLANAKIVLGEEDGIVSIVYNGETNTINVTVSAA